MKIRKSSSKDLPDYLTLKKYQEKEYPLIFGKELILPSDFILKKEFYNILHSRKSLLIVAEEKNNLVGYLQGILFGKRDLQKLFFNSLCDKVGYVADIFVLKEFRRKSIATSLIDKFVKNLKSRKYEEMYLSVNTKNKDATNLYDKLGLEISRYEMVKIL